MKPSLLTIDWLVHLRNQQIAWYAQVRIAKQRAEDHLAAPHTQHVVSMVRAGKRLLIDYAKVMQDACDSWKSFA